MFGRFVALIATQTAFSQLPFLLAPNAHEILWRIVFRHIYWMVACAYPFPELVVVEAIVICCPCPLVRWIAIDDIAFSELIVLVRCACGSYR